ncbi:MAG: FAD-binding oxidoreductase [Acetobacteraceae bacterium]|nr:FAD-binding oxidoreductase [Acetobacteraceae bacterium]
MDPSPRTAYAETALAAPETPPLTNNTRVDVAVIGGGFTGLSTALHLAMRGVHVAVLEAREPGWGASGRNGGQVNPGLKHDPDQIERDFGPELGRRMIALSGNAPNVVFDLIQRHQIACEARQSGTIRAAALNRDARAVRAAAEQWLHRGAPASLLGPSELHAVTGADRYVCALLDRRGGQLNPLSYARGLARVAIQAGASVHGNTRSLRVQRNGRAWQVRTPRASLHADYVVLATNGYTDALWTGLQLSIVPVFSAIIASEPLPDTIAAAILPSRSVLYEVGHITTYYRIDLQNRLLMGGRSVQRDVRDVSDLRYLIRYAQRLWPALRGVRWTHAWSGQLALTPDHYPHVHEPAPGILACLGYNGRGVAMSTAMGAQIANRLLGGEIDMPVTTIRQIPFQALWRSAVQGRMIYGRIRDWLGL